MSALIPITQTDDGRQAVSGRALHEFLEVGAEYRHWFPRMVAYGFTEGQDYTVISDRVARQGRGTVERQDHILTLDMAKEVSMIQRNEKGRQARQYFIECEKRAKESPELSGPELMAYALREADSTIKGLEDENRRLAPRADVADKFLNDDGDYSVADAAKVLTRAGVKTGQNRLFSVLQGLGWIFRAKGDGKWRVKQSALDSKHMSVLPQSHYHPKTGVLVVDPPQPRMTFKGIARIGVMYGVVIEPEQSTVPALDTAE